MGPFANGASCSTQRPALWMWSRVGKILNRPKEMNASGTKVPARTCFAPNEPPSPCPSSHPQLRSCNIPLAGRLAKCTHVTKFSEPAIAWGSMEPTTPWTPCPMHVPLPTHVGLSSLALVFILFHPHFDVFAFLLLVSPSFNVVGELQILATFQFCSLDCLSLVVVPLFQSFFLVCILTNISISSLLLSLSCALL